MKNICKEFKKLLSKKKPNDTGKLYSEIIAGEGGSILLKGHIYDGPVVILSDKPEIISNRGRMAVPIIRIGSDKEIIGYCTMIDAGLKVKFKQGANVTRSEFFKMFGCGATLTELDVIPDGETDLENFIIVEAIINDFILESV